jgi:hypothetical protein
MRLESRRPPRQKNDAFYSCAVNATLTAGAIVLLCLLFAGIQLGMRFQSSGVRGPEPVVGPVRSNAAVEIAASRVVPDDLVRKITHLLNVVGLQRSLPTAPDATDLVDAVGAAIPVIASQRDAVKAQQNAVANIPIAPSQRSRNAVIGMAMKIDVPNLYRFVRSCRDHIPDADIVLWVDDDSGERGEILQMFGVKVSSGGRSYSQ